MRHPSSRTVASIVGVVALALTAAYCTDGDVPTSSLNKPITQDALARVAAARAKVGVVGTVHSAMVRDISKRGIGFGPKHARTTAQNCRMAWEVTQRHTAGFALPAEGIAAAENALARVGCTSRSGLMAAVRENPLSIFLQEVPSGQYLEYEPALESAINNAASAADVEAATWPVVNQAAANGISQADLEALVSTAVASVTSAYDWQSVDASGGLSGGGGGGPGGELPYSMFQVRELIGWRKIVLADLKGAAVGAAGGLWGACIGAVAASAYSFLSGVWAT
jgi:hypothetical protein